jgi:hypothetical protein
MDMSLATKLLIQNTNIQKTFYEEIVVRNAAGVNYSF